MQECCKHWKKQKKVYTEQICVNNKSEEGISPFVKYMRRIIGCPNCLEPFDKPVVKDKRASCLCPRCGNVVLPDWVTCVNCGELNEGG